MSNTGSLPVYLNGQGIIKIAVYRCCHNSEWNGGLYMPIGNCGWNANVLHVGSTDTRFVKNVLWYSCQSRIEK